MKSRRVGREAELLQVLDGRVRLCGRHQDVVVVEARDHVGADGVARQLRRHRRRQPHRVQARVDAEGDAAEGVRAVEPCKGHSHDAAREGGFERKSKWIFCRGTFLDLGTYFKNSTVLYLS